MILKAIRAGVGFGSGTETTSRVHIYCDCIFCENVNSQKLHKSEYMQNISLVSELFVDKQNKMYCDKKVGRIWERDGAILNLSYL